MSKRFIATVRTPVFRGLLWLYRNAPLSIRQKRRIGNFALRLWPRLTTETMLAKAGVYHGHWHRICIHHVRMAYYHLKSW
jgi:hypothetical protein